MAHEIKAKWQFTVTDLDIDDIVCGALEGGITYWCREAKVVGEYLGEYAHEQIARGGELKLYDREEGEWHTLNAEKLVKGIQKAFEEGYAKPYWILDDGTGLECGMIDANDCDTIVQLALFDEVVYG